MILIFVLEGENLIFQSLEGKNLHLVKAKPIGPYNCQLCGRSYTYRRGLTQHLNFECGKEKRFQCPHCPYRCKLKFNLKSHIAHTHSSSFVTDLNNGVL